MATVKHISPLSALKVGAVVYAVFSLIVGAIGGAIGAALYNLAAGWVGGLEVEIN